MVILNAAPTAEAGAASGLLNTMQQLGGTLGLAILVTVFGTATGGAATTAGVAPPADVLVDGMVSAFEAAAVFSLLALAIVAVAIRTSREQVPEALAEAA
jgi:hypothetical protein